MSFNVEDVVCIIVGINHWSDITQPLVSTISLHEPLCPIVLVDNQSDPEYPKASYPDFGQYMVVRTKNRCGYGSALNFGMQNAPRANQYILLNNDNLCRRPFMNYVKELDRNTLWGSMEHRDVKHKIDFVQSAWLVVSSEIWEKVGKFDERLDAAYEDLDYEMRCWENGFEVKVAQLPFHHLDRHTRYEEAEYNERWCNAMKLFSKKWNLKESPWTPKRK